MPRFFKAPGKRTIKRESSETFSALPASNENRGFRRGAASKEKRNTLGSLENTSKRSRRNKKVFRSDSSNNSGYVSPRSVEELIVELHAALQHVPGAPPRSPAKKLQTRIVLALETPEKDMPVADSSHGSLLNEPVMVIPETPEKYKPVHSEQSVRMLIPDHLGPYDWHEIQAHVDGKDHPELNLNREDYLSAYDGADAEDDQVVQDVLSELYDQQKKERAAILKRCHQRNDPGYQQPADDPLQVHQPPKLLARLYQIISRRLKGMGETIVTETKIKRYIMAHRPTLAHMAFPTEMQTYLQEKKSAELASLPQEVVTVKACAVTNTDSQRWERLDAQVKAQLSF